MTRSAAPSASVLDAPLRMVPGACCVCGCRRGDPIGSGEDFEYRTSPDGFRARRCDTCGVVYLDPRPDLSELARIYPDHYHAFEFSTERFGLVHRVRRRLEARRLLRSCRRLPADARILDVGCGDGFHLDILREHGRRGWRLEGVDSDERAVVRARARGLEVHHSTLDDAPLPSGAYDLAFVIQTIEHVADPRGLLERLHELLRRSGRVVIVTDNTGSPDFQVFRRRYWGGYHFPRHWHLFDRRSIAELAGRVGFAVESVETIVSPVNWTYSIRNLLVDRGAPGWLVDRFGLDAPVALAFFTAFDQAHQLLGRGALLRATLRKP